MSEPIIQTGINGREFLRQSDLTLKERNAARKAYEADGWDVDTHGSNRGGWTIQATKGEHPFVIRMTIRIGEGSYVTPLYKRADGDGWEHIDGSPQRGET